MTDFVWPAAPTSSEITPPVDDDIPREDSTSPAILTQLNALSLSKHNSTETPHETTTFSSSRHASTESCVTVSSIATSITKSTADPEEWVVDEKLNNIVYRFSRQSEDETPTLVTPRRGTVLGYNGGVAARRLQFAAVANPKQETLEERLAAEERNHGEKNGGKVGLYLTSEQAIQST